MKPGRTATTANLAAKMLKRRKKEYGQAFSLPFPAFLRASCAFALDTPLSSVVRRQPSVVIVNDCQNDTLPARAMPVNIGKSNMRHSVDIPTQMPCHNAIRIPHGRDANDCSRHGLRGRLPRCGGKEGADDLTSAARNA